METAMLPPGAVAKLRKTQKHRKKQLYCRAFISIVLTISEMTIFQRVFSVACGHQKVSRDEVPAGLEKVGEEY